MKITIPERILETYTYKDAIIELVERPETLYAGKSIHANGPGDGLDGAFGARLDEEHMEDFSRVAGKTQPEYDVHVSINFWHPGHTALGFVFAREATSEDQPEGVDVFRMPASLFLRMYSDRAAARLLGKDACEPWELFAFFRAKIMPKFGFVMAENGAQELEIYEPGGHECGWAYVPVEQKRRRSPFGFKRKSAPDNGAA